MGFAPLQVGTACLLRTICGGSKTYQNCCAIPLTRHWNTAAPRDHSEIGWTGTIGRGGTFLGTLRITNVDINRATGVVELENQLTRGRVDVSDRVLFRSGR